MLRRPCSARDLGIESRLFSERRLLVCGSTAAVSYEVGLAWLLIRHEWLSRAGKPCNDFNWIWLSSKFALFNSLDRAYHYPAFLNAHANLFGSPYCILEHFDYPPTLLLFTYPLGAMPYPIAFAVWMAATLTLYLAAIYAIIPRPAAVIAALTTYPVVFNVLMGHNGFLTAGLMGLSLVFVERRPRLSGILLGLLTYKPQLGILFPFALLASRNWRVLLTATGSSVMFGVAAAIAFGYRAWPSFIGALTDRASDVGNAPEQAFTSALVSVFAVLRTAGVSAHTSWAMQLAVTAIVAATVCALWAARSIPHSLKAAVLATGSLLASPHAHGYDACILTIAVAFLVKDGLERGFLPRERGTILGCWAGLFLLTGPVPAIICVVLLILVVRRVMLCRSDAVGTAPALAKPVLADEGYSPPKIMS